MKVLILGAKGMLGNDLTKEFEDLNPVLWDREELDISARDEVFSKISDVRPQIIINAAAYTNVDEAETNKELAEKANGYALKYLASVSSKVGAIFVHYSTDYVFSGRNPNGYQENSRPTRPLNIYGYSKLLGERFLLGEARKSGLRYFLIRTSWLYGKNGRNFVDTILNLAKEKEEFTIVNDQFGKPTYSVDLAMMTRTLLNVMPPGIYHITNSTPPSGISWYDFAKKITEIKNLNTKIKPRASFEYPRPAKRPRYSMLVNTKLEPLRDWDEALKEYLASAAISHQPSAISNKE